MWGFKSQNDYSISLPCQFAYYMPSCVTSYYHILVGASSMGFFPSIEIPLTAGMSFIWGHIIVCIIKYINKLLMISWKKKI